MFLYRGETFSEGAICMMKLWLMQAWASTFRIAMQLTAPKGWQSSSLLWSQTVPWTFIWLAVYFGYKAPNIDWCQLQIRFFIQSSKKKITHIDGLVQDCSNSIALAMELLQFCTEQSIWTCQKCPISSPHEQGMGCLSWVYGEILSCYGTHCTTILTTLPWQDFKNISEFLTHDSPLGKYNLIFQSA